MKLFLQLISFSLTSSQCRVCAVLRGVPHPGYSTHRGTGGLDPIPGDILTTATSLQGGDRTHGLKLSHSVKIFIDNHFFDRSLLNLPGTFAQCQGFILPGSPDLCPSLCHDQQQGLGSVWAPAQHPQSLADVVLSPELSSQSWVSHGEMVLCLVPAPALRALLPPCSGAEPSLSFVSIKVREEPSPFKCQDEVSHPPVPEDWEQ